MRVSIRIKRNISLTLLIVGGLCIIARGWQAIHNPDSVRTWFNFFSITVITYFCYDRFRYFSKRMKSKRTFDN